MPTLLPRRFSCFLLTALLLGLMVGTSHQSQAADANFVVSPPVVTLQGNDARGQLLVTQGDAAGGSQSADLTSQATYASSQPLIVTVSPTGRLLARGNGSANLTITVGTTSRTVPVSVAGIDPLAKVGFNESVMPILSRAGCNAGACHASQYGKGGFKLSVFGFAPEDDHKAIVRERFGRLANSVNPAESLFLQKPTSEAIHEGGRRLEKGSIDYQILERWLAAGAPGPSGAANPVTDLKVHPPRRVGARGFNQQLQVIATFADGKARDVTHWARFDSMDDSVLTVNADGLVRTIGKGQGTAMIRFGGHSAISMFIVPYADSADLGAWKDNNFIDTLAAAKFREIGIPPSGLCDDATFLRRAFLDVTGTLPSVEQAKTFLASTDPAKRQKLVDLLLGLTGDPKLNVHDNDYAAYWALKWSDLIRSNSAAIGEQGMWALNNWLKTSFRENKPFDKIVRELVTAKGSTFSNGPANYFRIASNPPDLTEATTQLFLGVRLQCAKCHNHPYEPFSQTDYYAFAAFFARVGNKASQEFGLFGGETVIMNQAGGEVSHPRTGKILPPTPLRGKPVTETNDRRQSLADWMTAKDNNYFARNLVNRMFAYLMGRGLVEPIDDMRGTNPASNPELLDALAKEFIRTGYDQKQLIRLILNSRLYQLDSQPLPGNAADVKFHSHYHVKRIPAEPLLDAIDSATGVRTKFEKVPLGTKAIELPDAKYNNYFLSAFGKPRREAVCECERVSEPNLAQALHTLNGDMIETKIATPTGRVGVLMAEKKSPVEIIENLYLATLSREPTREERETCLKLLAEAKDPKAFHQDLLWSLLNTKQFQFVH